MAYAAPAATNSGSVNVGGVPGTPGNSNLDAYIPEIWTTEMMAEREKNLVAAKFFLRKNHKGQKGDTIYMMLADNLSVQDKTAGAVVTPEAFVTGKVAITINKHKYVSTHVEDVADAQSIIDMRREFTRSAGYKMALQMETDIWAALHAGLASAYKVVGADGTTAFAAGNFSDITDAGLRKVRQTLQDNNVDVGKCKLFIPPSQENAMLGIDKFTLYNYIGRTSELQKGVLGSIYGIPVVVTTALPWIDAAGAITTEGAAGAGRMAVLASPDTLVVAPQWDIRFQTEYQLENLGRLLVADMVYGIKTLRVATTNSAASGYRKSEAVALFVP